MARAHSHAADGVWVTIELTPKNAALSIYDTAPDGPTRICLDTHPFPLLDTVAFLSQKQLALLPQPSPGRLVI